MTQVLFLLLDVEREASGEKAHGLGDGERLGRSEDVLPQNRERTPLVRETRGRRILIRSVENGGSGTHPGGTEYLRVEWTEKNDGR